MARRPYRSASSSSRPEFLDSPHGPLHSAKEDQDGRSTVERHWMRSTRVNLRNNQIGEVTGEGQNCECVVVVMLNYSDLKKTRGTRVLTPSRNSLFWPDNFARSAHIQTLVYKYESAKKSETFVECLGFVIFTKSFLIFQVLVKYVMGNNRLPLWGRIVHLKLAVKFNIRRYIAPKYFVCISILQNHV